MEERYFDVDNYRIYQRIEGEGKSGTVFVCHGLADHIGRYEKIWRALVDNGYRVMGVDFPGHGRSSGKRGDIPSFELLYKIIDQAIDYKLIEPLYLLGHSLGGLIAVRYVEERVLPKKCVISSGLFYLSPDKVSPTLMTFAKIMKKIYPSLTLNNQINPEHISRKRAEVESYKKDPLVHKLISVRLFFEMVNNIELAYQRIGVTPILVLVGEEDKLTPPISGEKIYSAWKGEKYIKRYNMAHELFHDPEGDKVIADVLEFLQK